MPIYDATVRPIELLAMTPARVNRQPAVVVTVRMSPASSFAATDLSLSKEQAERLRDDLTSLLNKEFQVWEK